MVVFESDNECLPKIEPLLHRASFYLSDTESFQCGHLRVGDVCHVYSKYTIDGLEPINHICNECNSLSLDEVIFVSQK